MIIALVFLISSCSTQQATSTETPQPSATAGSFPQPTTMIPGPSPIPFTRYGERLLNVAYCSMDAAQIMDVYFPPSGGPWPVLVYVHGGSWMHGDKSEALLFADQMAIQGYLVVSINYRLYPPATFPAMIEDVKCAIRSLRAHAVEYNFDPNRVGVIGVSAGGHLVSLLGTTDQSAGWDVGEHLDRSSRVQAVIAMAGVMDLSRNFPNADIETMKRVGFGEFNVVPASPISHVTPDDPPFLLIHGANDELVPYEQSQVMYERLVQMNVPAQLLIVQNASHSFVGPTETTTPTLGEINQIILDFLAKYLK